MSPAPHTSPTRLLLVGFIVLIVAAGIAFALYRRAAARAAQSEDWGAAANIKNAANPVPPTAESLAVAKSLYSEDCARCHGDSGKGDGSDVAMYKTKPSDLTTPRVAAMKAGEIFWKITTGRLPMPAYENRLSETQRWQLVAYLRTLAAPASP
jgi:mono/diheme cytochrome c family protein